MDFNSSWRFDAPFGVEIGFVNEIGELIGKIAAQGNQQTILEHFKSRFAGVCGNQSSWSSNASWSETDLTRYMQDASENAPLFVEAFFEGCEALRSSDLALQVPDVAFINGVMDKHNVGLVLAPPKIILSGGQAKVNVPLQNTSLEEQAVQKIREALNQSEQFLLQRKWRQAIQEIFWLLESVVHAFDGLETKNGTVKGKYFNKIAVSLRGQNKGKVLEHAAKWMTTMHGYLSSPTGGGIRHGEDLRSDITLGEGEARLLCNLARSYIDFLLAEHARLSNDD